MISAVPLIWSSPPLAAAAVGVARLIAHLLSSGGASPEKDGRELLRSIPVDLVPLPVAPAKRVPPDHAVRIPQRESSEVGRRRSED